MKNKLLPLLLVSLSSCSILDNKNIAPGYIEAYKSISSLFGDNDDGFITEALINNIPYASSLLKIGDGPNGLIILEGKNNTTTTWVSADGIYLVIRNGKIIQTLGLKNNLVDYISYLKDFNYLDFRIEESFVTYYSYDNPTLNNLRVNSTIRTLEQEEVLLFSKKKMLTLVQETLYNDYLGWSVTNKYWVDDTNFVWKSIQYVSPKLPPFYIEVTKKPAN